ncbi:MAG TPA: hypothetical protein VFU47_00045, partial [Armatimonadota bacterium]|nr:hypothetical protein [Armatimonadota bacterium]
MADDLISVVGGQCLIDHQITPEDGSIIATATVSIYDPAGAKVIDAASMTVTAGDGTNGYDDGAYGVKYAFTTTGQDPGNYTYAITPNTGPTIRGTFTLWPEWSALDPYVQQIQDLLQDTEMGEAQRFLSLRDY